MRIRRMGRLFCEVELQDLTVTMLLDGETVMPVEALLGPDGVPLAAEGLAGADLREGKLRLPVRAFLVRGPGGCLMIDTGAAEAWHKGLGQLGAAMIAAEVAAREVTAVALTHAHVDHVSGLVDAEGGLAFPNAFHVHVPSGEIRAVRAMPRLAPVGLRILPLEMGDGPMPGVFAIAAPGHSPGHTAYLVEGRILIWGDVVHHAALQFARPEIGWKYDDDLARARASRLALMDQAVDHGWIVAGAHLPGPGIGWIERSGKGYAFRPISRGH